MPLTGEISPALELVGPIISKPTPANERNGTALSFSAVEGLVLAGQGLGNSDSPPETTYRHKKSRIQRSNSLACTISLQALKRCRFTGAGAVIQSAESALLDCFISPFNAIHAERERVPILLRPRTKYGE